MSGAVHPLPSEPLQKAGDRLAAIVRGLLLDGRRGEARELFGEIVAIHQRRASGIAYHYLENAADTDEAVQDAFVKTFANLTSYRDDLSFEVWFTRILVNGCLDRLKARKRRSRWLMSLVELPDVERRQATAAGHAGSSPEERLIQHERRRALKQALDVLPPRQRTVFLLSHHDGCSTREVSEITGLRESTVRVHLFRAIHRLRKLLGPAATMSVKKDRVG